MSVFRNGVFFSSADLLKRTPNGSFAEIKYDGERIQIHMEKGAFKCFSRNKKPVRTVDK